MTAEGKVDVIMFFWDPLTSEPRDADVKTLLRLAVLYDVPIACNRSTADFLISSPMFKDWKRERRSSRDWLEDGMAGADGGPSQAALWRTPPSVRLGISYPDFRALRQLSGTYSGVALVEELQ